MGLPHPRPGGSYSVPRLLKRSLSLPPCERVTSHSPPVPQGPRATLCCQPLDSRVFTRDKPVLQAHGVVLPEPRRPLQPLPRARSSPAPLVRRGKTTLPHAPGPPYPSTCPIDVMIPGGSLPAPEGNTHWTGKMKIKPYRGAARSDLPWCCRACWVTSDLTLQPPSEHKSDHLC